MKKLILVALMIFTMNMAVAETNMLNGLSDQEIAQLNVTAAQMRLAKEQVEAAPISSALDKIGNIELSDENLDKFSKYGEKAAKIITGFATEIGITVSQFLDTKWGVVAAVLVGWHYYGSDLALLGFAGLFSLFFLPIWIGLARAGLYEKITTLDGNGEVIRKKNGMPIFNRVFDIDKLNSSIGGTLVWSLIIFIIIQLILVVNIG